MKENLNSGIEADTRSLNNTRLINSPATTIEGPDQEAGTLTGHIDQGITTDSPHTKIEDIGETTAMIVITIIEIIMITGATNIMEPAGEIRGMPIIITVINSSQGEVLCSIKRATLLERTANGMSVKRAGLGVAAVEVVKQRWKKKTAICLLGQCKTPSIQTGNLVTKMLAIMNIN